MLTRSPSNHCSLPSSTTSPNETQLSSLPSLEQLETLSPSPSTSLALKSSSVIQQDSERRRMRWRRLELRELGKSGSPSPSCFFSTRRFYRRVFSRFVPSYHLPLLSPITSFLLPSSLPFQNLFLQPPTPDPPSPLPPLPLVDPLLRPPSPHPPSHHARHPHPSQPIRPHSTDPIPHGARGAGEREDACF